MQHISYHLHTLVRRCTPEGVLLDSYCARAQFKDQFSTEELTALFQSFSADTPVSQQEIPLLLLSGKQAAYALIPCRDFLFLIGPVGFSQPVYLKNQYTPEHLDDAWLKAVPVCEFSDSYIQKIEECRDIPAVFHLFHTAEYEYAQMVKDINAQKEGISAKDRNPHINKCKDYIFSHLHEKITVQEIANALGLNATYLGFSSQSHLGKYFKESTGMTLHQYRDVYGVKEFDSLL